MKPNPASTLHEWDTITPNTSSASVQADDAGARQHTESTRKPPSSFSAAMSAFQGSCRNLPIMSMKRWQSEHSFVNVSEKDPFTLPFSWKPKPICIDHKGRFLHLDSLRAAPFNQNILGPTFANSATWTPMSRHSEELGMLLEQGLVRMHTAVGLMIFGRWASVNVFHFTADVLLSAAAFLVSNPSVLSAPHAPVFIHESLILNGFHLDQGFCHPCIQGAAALDSNTRLNYTLIVSTRNGSFRDASGAHCFCAAALIAPTSQAIRRTHAKSSKMHLGIWLLRRQLAVRYDLTPYGTRATAEIVAGWRLWNDRAPPTAVAKPRLLMLLRLKSRFFAHVSNISEMAREVGFRVHMVAFENLNVERQFAAARYADVILGMHGAALTYLYMMDPSTPFCRTVIELLPWVAQTKVAHNLELGKLCNITVRQIEAVDVVFGRSVRKKKQTRQRLRSGDRNVYMMPGFSDQTAIHSLDAVRQELLWAHKRYASCA